MSGKRDLTGRRYGKLLVTEKTKKRWNGLTVYICKCDCHGTFVATSQDLKSGKHIDCGCVIKYCQANQRDKITGQFISLK